MIPAWKLRREFHRLGEFGWSVLGNLYEPWLKLRHDRWRSAAKVLDGAVPILPKIALVLVFQPKGLSASTYACLRFLADKGYAPFVISNAPLSAVDQAQVRVASWRVLERPNFGYDFGGYRDGILLLQDWAIRPDRLLVLNDSFWLPARADCDLIDRLEALPGDVVGGFRHPPVRRGNGRADRAAYLESYLYLFNPSALAAPTFQRFWQGYRMSSNKMNAVYRGERGFSARMAEGGVSVNGLFGPQLLLDRLAQEPDSELRLTLVYAAFSDADFATERHALLAEGSDSADWRLRALNFMARVVARRRFNASFPYACDKLLGMAIIKKSVGPAGASKQTLHSQSRRCLLQAVDAGDLPPLLAEVDAEMRALEGLARPAQIARPG